MGENLRQQILTQEIVRRLGNACEGLANKVYEGISLPENDEQWV